MQPDLLAWRVLPSSVAHVLEGGGAWSFTWQTLVTNVRVFTRRLAPRIILQVYLALLSKQAIGLFLSAGQAA